MSTVRLIEQPPSVVRLIGEAGEVVRVLADAPSVVRVMAVGTQGPAGAGVATPFEQNFAAAASWTVNHNLGRRPASVRVLTPGGVEAEADVTEISLNQVIVSFAAPQAGRAIVL